MKKVCLDLEETFVGQCEVYAPDDWDEAKIREELGQIKAARCAGSYLDSLRYAGFVCISPSLWWKRGTVKHQDYPIDVVETEEYEVPPKINNIVKDDIVVGGVYHMRFGFRVVRLTVERIENGIVHFIESTVDGDVCNRSTTEGVFIQLYNRHGIRMSDK